MNLRRQTRAALTLELLLAAAVFAAFVIGGQVGQGLFSLGLLLGLIAVLWFGRTRSETVELMSGIGDERTRDLYQRSLSMTANVLVFVLIGWWLVSVAVGEQNETVAQVCAIAGVTWLGSILWLRRHS